MVEEVKEYLKITWDDEDVYIGKMIERGKDKLQNLTGTSLDFNLENSAKTLLLDYCRYSYNNALEYFEKNFESEILRLQLQEAVKENEQAEQA